MFGYGSLVWRPSFPFLESRPAALMGFVRRFWQGSTDHRGVPGAPGRVVTLVREPQARCAGVAYRIAAKDRPAVLEHLDWREKGGYERLFLPVEGRHGERIQPVVVYLATDANPNYLGPAPLREIAAQVRSSHGPSGANRDYVVRLAGALRELGEVDTHVFGLEKLLMG